MTIHRWTWTLVLGAVMGAPVGPGAGAAQQGPPGRMEMERRVWARFGEVIRERLDLTADEQRRLGEVLRSYQEQREALALREAQLRRRIVTQGVLGPGGAGPLLSDEQAREILSEWGAVWDEERRLVQEEQGALLEILTPAELVRLYALREALNDRVRGFRRRGPPGTGAGGGPPGPIREIPER